MKYQDTIDAIEMTERLFREAQREAAELRKFFEQNGCYDEHDAQDAWERQQAVRSALNGLYAQLPRQVGL